MLAAAGRPESCLRWLDLGDGAALDGVPLEVLRAATAGLEPGRFKWRLQSRVLAKYEAQIQQLQGRIRETEERQEELRREQRIMWRETRQLRSKTAAAERILRRVFNHLIESSTI